MRPKKTKTITPQGIKFGTFKKLQAKLRHESYLIFRVTTGSMLPLIPIGGQIRVVPLFGLPKRFDILVFWDGNLLICHYFWHLNQYPSDQGEPILVTRPLKGGEDIPFSVNRVLGIVTSHRLCPVRRSWLVVRAVWKNRRP